MDYQVLARKWRPRSFETLVGQEHVVRALTNALDTGRIHHAWLFTGTRGVGKTTLARILAKCLNCESGISSHPTDCQTCREIDEGRFVDYIEVDAASNRGVDEITPLLEQAVYPPSQGRFKIYTIDEVHMLSGHAFNAMLKTLEEPPPHLKFILATTDPQKIPITVLSRCIQYNLKRMTPEAIVSHLQNILQREGIQSEEAGLRLIAQAAAGSMRDALSLTDQAIAYSSGSITAQAMQDMLGTIDSGYLINLLEALTHNRPQEIIKLADALAERSASFDAALADFALMLSQISMEQRIPGTLSKAEPHYEKLYSLASQLPADLLQLFYVIALNGRSELSRAPDEYAGFVMICLRMLSLTSGDDVQQFIGEAMSASAGQSSGLSNTAKTAQPTASSASATAADNAAEAQSQIQPTEDKSAVSTAAHSAVGANNTRSEANNSAPMTGATTPHPAEHPAAADRQNPSCVTQLTQPQNATPADAPVSADKKEAGTSAPKPDQPEEGKVDLPWYEDDRPQQGAPMPDSTHAETSSTTNNSTPQSAPASAPSSKANSAEASGGHGQSQPSQTTSVQSSQAVQQPQDSTPKSTNSGSSAAPAKSSASTSANAAKQQQARAESLSASTERADKRQQPAAHKSSADADSESAAAIGQSAHRSEPPANQKSATKAALEAGAAAAQDDYSEYYSSELNADPGRGDDVELSSNLIYQNPEPLAPTADSSSRPSPSQLNPQLWTEVVRDLPLTGLAAEVLKNAEWVRTENNLIVLRSFFRNAENMSAMKDITTALTEYFSRVVRLSFINGQTSGDTVSAQDELKLAQRLEKAKSEIHADPFVQSLIRDFAASVKDDSIQLLN